MGQIAETCEGLFELVIKRVVSSILRLAGLRTKIYHTISLCLSRKLLTQFDEYNITGNGGIFNFK